MAKEANLNGYNWRGFAIVNLLVSKLHLLGFSSKHCMPRRSVDRCPPMQGSSTV